MKNLKSKIDRAFSINQEVSKLNKELKLLKAALKTHAEEIGETKLEGKIARFHLDTHKIQVIDTIALHEKVGTEIFVECVKPVKKLVEEHLNAKEIKEISTLEPQKQIRFTKI